MPRKHDPAALAEAISIFLRTVGEATNAEVSAFLHRRASAADIRIAMMSLIGDNRVAMRKVAGLYKKPKTLWRSLEKHLPLPTG